MCVRAIVLCFLVTLSILMSEGQVVKANTSVEGNWPQLSSADKKSEGVLEALLEGSKCYGRKCLNSGQCCQGTVCVNVEGNSGSCLPEYGRELNHPCVKDSDCGEGLMCADTIGTCVPEERPYEKRGFNDECYTSADCEVERNLCCQVLRRHRMAPKRLCHYFVDPKSCLGEVQTALKEIKFIPNSYFKARLG